MTSNIWNLGWTITTKSLHGHLYVVNIYTKDAVSSVQALIPAATAFEFQTETSEDVLTPVRGSTGYVRYIFDGNTYDVMPETMTDRYVEVTRDGDVFWQGFLKAETFDDVYDTITHEVAIPCHSLLDALAYVNIDIPVSDPTAVTFKRMVVDAFDALMGEQTTILDYLFFPRAGSGSTFHFPSNVEQSYGDVLSVPLWCYGFCDYDEESADANTNGFVGWSWLKVFEEYMKILGTSMHVAAGSLYMTIPTVEDDYSRYSWERMRNGGASVNVYGRKLSLLDEVAFESTNNTTSVTPPMHSVKFSLGCRSFEYGAKFDKDKLYDTVTYQTFPHGDYYYQDGYTGKTWQPNLSLVQNVASIAVFDVWKQSEDDEHKTYSWKYGIRVEGNTAAKPQTPYRSDCVEAFTLTGITPFNGKEGGIFESGLLINGSATKWLVPDTSANPYIVASLHLSGYWWVGGRWMSDAEAASLGNEPVFLLYLDEGGKIKDNANLTSEDYLLHSDKGGYLMPFGAQYGLTPTDIVGVPVLKIYEPFGYQSGEFQVITDLSLEYTSQEPSQKIEYGVNSSWAGAWRHVRFTGEFSIIANAKGQGEYELDLNISNATANPGMEWYAPPAYLVLGPFYAFSIYDKPLNLIKVGNAYAPDVLPYDILKRDGVRYRILSYGMNTYDDEGKVILFITDLGEE